MSRPNAVLSTILVLAVVLSFGCIPRQETSPVATPPAEEAGPAVSVEIENGRAALGQEAKGAMTVRNTLDRAIALLRVELLTADEAVFAEGGAESVPAQVTEDGAIIEGTLYVDNPGAEARVKFPDRWEWSGSDELVHFPVLRPGRDFRLSGSFRVTHETGNRVVGVVRFAPMADSSGLLAVAEQTAESLPQPAEGTFGKGWVAARRMKVTVTRGAEFSASAHERKRWTSADLGPALPAHYPHALTRADFDVLLGSAKAVHVEQTFAVDPSPAAP